MADLARAEELVQAMDRDDAFRAEVEAAPTAAAKRQLLDARGYQDVGLEDMKAYVESKGGKLVARPGGRELTDQELAAVAGAGPADLVPGTSMTELELAATVVGVGAAAAAAAA